MIPHKERLLLHFLSDLSKKAHKDVKHSYSLDAIVTYPQHTHNLWTILTEETQSIVTEGRWCSRCLFSLINPGDCA